MIADCAYLVKAEGKTWQLKGEVAKCDVEMAQVRRDMWNCCYHFEREGKKEIFICLAASSAAGCCTSGRGAGSF